MIVSLLCTSLRAAAKVETKLLGLNTLLRAAAYVDDELCLDRIAPFVIAMLSDPSSVVQAEAIDTLADFFQDRKIPRSDQRIFVDYVFPNIGKAASSPDSIVRIALARSLPLLAEAAVICYEASQVGCSGTVRMLC